MANTDFAYDYPIEGCDRHSDGEFRFGDPKQAKGARIEIRDEAGLTSGEVGI